MGWWNGSDGTRLLIAPDSNATESSGRLLSLLHPKSGTTTCYLFNNGVLQEINWFKQSYRSWFLGDYVCEDGRIFTATPVDPVFMMLPLFQEARMKKGDDPGKFRLLEEIIFVNGYPGYQYLLPVAENCMHVVCETKEIGSSIFFRLDDSKVLSWLSYKVRKLKETLPLLDKNYAAQDEKDTLADAVSILGEYVKDEPWLKLLCNNLNLNFPVESIKSQEMEVLQSSMETNLKSSNLFQGKNKSEKKSKTAKQTKKAKVETESRNIKDMFSRASRRGS
ncbi:ribonuclease H2 subunit B [Mangifera indica]|uniref:ribonuclease H2 subunit B n=1 Tax=Mangifera indica TaxID=29780 RepID=UPI001CFA9A32|nr:ribonuclease H2 subunit B [Mangifera indica]